MSASDPPLPLSLAERERQPPAAPASTILSDRSPAPAIGALDDPVRPPTLVERVAWSKARLDNLRAGAADAALRNEPFDGARLVQAAAEVDALAGAEQLAHTRSRQAEAASLAAHRAELRAAVKVQLEMRQRGLAAAQVAIETGVAAIKRALDATAEIRRIGVHLGKPPSTVLDDRSQRLLISQSLARLFNGLGGDTHHFGSLSWPSLPLPPTDPAWGRSGPETAAITELLTPDAAQPAADPPSDGDTSND